MSNCSPQYNPEINFKSQEKIHNKNLVCACNTRSMLNYSIQHTATNIDTNGYSVPYLPDCKYNSWACRCVSRISSCTCAERVFQESYIVDTNFRTTSICDIHEYRGQGDTNCSSKKIYYCDCRIREFIDSSNLGSYEGYAEECVEVFRDCECNGRTTTGLINYDNLPFYSATGCPNVTSKCTNTNRYVNYTKIYNYGVNTSGYGYTDLSRNQYFYGYQRYASTGWDRLHCLCQSRQKNYTNSEIRTIADTSILSYNTLLNKNYSSLNTYTSQLSNISYIKDNLQDCLCKNRSLYTKSYLSTDCNCVNREIYNTNDCQNNACFCNTEARICDCQKRSMLANCPCDMRQWGDICICNENNGKIEYGYCDCDFRNSEIEEYQYVKMSDCKCYNRAFPDISCTCDSRNTSCYIHVFIDSAWMTEPYKPMYIATMNDPGQAESKVTANYVKHSDTYNIYACDCNGRNYMKDKTEPYKCLCFFKSVVSEYAKIKNIPLLNEYMGNNIVVEYQNIDPENTYAARVPVYNLSRNDTLWYTYTGYMHSMLIDKTITNRTFNNTNTVISAKYTYDLIYDNVNEIEIYEKEANAEDIDPLHKVCVEVKAIKNFYSTTTGGVSSLSMAQTGTCNSNLCKKVYSKFSTLNNSPFVYVKTDNTMYFKGCSTVNSIDNVPEGCEIFTTRYSNSINPCNNNTCETVYFLKNKNEYDSTVSIDTITNYVTIEPTELEKYPILLANECICKSRYIQDAGNDTNTLEDLTQPLRTNKYRKSNKLCECQCRDAKCYCHSRTSCTCDSRNNYVSSNPDVQNDSLTPDPNHSLNTCDCQRRAKEVIYNPSMVDSCQINVGTGVIDSQICSNNYEVKCQNRTGTSCKIVEFCRCNLRKDSNCIDKQSACTRYERLKCTYDHSITVDCINNTEGLCPNTALPTKHQCPYNIKGCTGRWTANTQCFSHGSQADCECNHTSGCECNVFECKCQDRMSSCVCVLQTQLLYPNEDACRCNIQKFSLNVKCLCQSRTDILQTEADANNANTRLRSTRATMDVDDCICNVKYKSCECKGRCTTNLKTDFFLAGEDVSYVTDENALKPNPQDPDDV